MRGLQAEESANFWLISDLKVNETSKVSNHIINVITCNVLVVFKSEINRPQKPIGLDRMYSTTSRKKSCVLMLINTKY